MENEQAKLLDALLCRLESQKRGKREAIESLHSAGILTKDGKRFTRPYANLGKAVKALKK
ncbi:MAG: hypothetical protein IBJ09_12620 [Bacteroidia bacterium]|nr:hypothetical protein [Bacteroidia bacterium]